MVGGGGRGGAGGCRRVSRRGRMVMSPQFYKEEEASGAEEE